MSKTITVALIILISATALPPSVQAADPAALLERPLRKAPAPLYCDPVHDGAADPTLIWNRDEKCWWMLYTNRRADADKWEFKDVILDKPGRRPGDHRIGQHPGFLVQDDETVYLVYFVHQAEKEPAFRHTWLQVVKLGFDGQTLTCDRDADFDFVLTPPRPDSMPEHAPVPRPKQAKP